jgi:hypothetical protein
LQIKALFDRIKCARAQQQLIGIGAELGDFRLVRSNHCARVRLRRICNTCTSGHGSQQRDG